MKTKEEREGKKKKPQRITIGKDNGEKIYINRKKKFKQ